MKIEKNIPIPSKRTMTVDSKYEWMKTLYVGDSFVADTKAIAWKCIAYAKRNMTDWKFVTRQIYQESNVLKIRVWRVK